MEIATPDTENQSGIGIGKSGVRALRQVGLYSNTA
jgi:hypothetical protein